MWLTQSKFTRTVSNGESSTGDAFISKQENYFEYNERGIYHGSHISFIQKRFIYLEANKLIILKENKEILHIFDNIHTFPLVHTHLCKDDRYTLTISYEDGIYKTNYVILGPHKNYRIETIYHALYNPS